MCTQCSFWHRPTRDGTGCEAHAVWWVIRLIILLCAVVIAALVALVVAAVNWAMKRLKQHEQARTVCVFVMKRSNINIIPLGDGLVASTHCLEFDGKLAVETESKELLCVGNASRGKVKVQLVESEKEREKATYRAQPDFVMLVRPA